MERLKTRQRLDQLNSAPAPLAFNEVRNTPPDDENAGHLASKIRVNSIINQSIPAMSYAPKKIKSHVTAKELAEFQLEESKPIEIDGQIYRMHPATIPEPEFGFDDVLIDINQGLTQMAGDEEEIARRVDDIKAAHKELALVNKQLVELDDDYNRSVNAESLATTNLLNSPFDVIKFAANIGREERDAKLRDLEETYLQAKEDLEARREGIIAFLDRTKIEIDDRRDEIERMREAIPTILAENKERSARNKAALRAYEENLKTMNRNFNIQQEQGETDEQYVARIRELTAPIEDPNLLLDRFNLNEARRFKENLKEIIRDTATIEYAYNTMFQEDDSSIADVNKVFALIKSRYEKTYGKVQLKDADLVKFLKQMILNPEEVARKAEEEEAFVSSLGGVGGFAGKYKALAKGKRFTKPALIAAIQEIIGLREDPVQAVVRGEVATLLVGPRGGLMFQFGGREKVIGAADKEILIAFYVELLETVKAKDRRLYDTLNEKLNVKTSDEYGEGVPHETLPKSCKLGKVEVDLNKLFYKNVLSVKQKGFKISGLKNAPVGDDFVKIVMELCKGVQPSTKELNKLGSESQIYDALLHVAGLHKRVEHTANKTVETLKNRMTLILGEMEAGNTNKSLLSELRDIVFKLHHLGEITQNAASDFLKQFKK